MTEFKEQTPFADYGRTHEGMLFVRVKSAERNTLESAKTGVSILKRLANGQKYPLLVDLTFAQELDIDARQFYINNSHFYASRIAVLTPSMLPRILGNFFLAMMQSAHGSALQTRLFQDRQEAVDWLFSKK